MGTMDYSKSIKRLREDKNLTVEELAKRLSIPSCEIERAESGDDNLDEKTLEEIARYFGVQYDSLVNGTVKSGKKDTIFDPTEWYKLDNCRQGLPILVLKRIQHAVPFCGGDERESRRQDFATSTRRSRAAFPNAYGDDKARCVLVLF